MYLGYVIWDNKWEVQILTLKEEFYSSYTTPRVGWKMSGGQHVCLVFGISSATASSSLLGRLRQLLLSPLIGQRERESEREKLREGKREEWEAMDSGIAFLGRGGSKNQDFC